ncbi:hypothetical protein C8R43DRAFT_1041765 [Mycena crocata]|nr:hypothetical protein C8R43DRAFT_1041765 [Mycena crocata]
MTKFHSDPRPSHSWTELIRMNRQRLPEPNTVYKLEPGSQTKFQLFKHPPPSKPKSNRLFDPAELYRERTQVNGRLHHCCLHRTERIAGAPSIEIRLVKPLTVGLRQGAQVWKVAHENQDLVARFYDPLFIDDGIGGDDVFCIVDKNVAAECTAFEAMPDLQGQIVPRFLGCYLLCLAVPEFGQSMPHTGTVEQSGSNMPPADVEQNVANAQEPWRSVYVTLAEYTPGDDLYYMRPGNFKRPICIPHRRSIMDAVVFAHFQIRRHHVLHCDFKERNIILHPRVESASTFKSFCDSPVCDLRTVPRGTLPGCSKSEMEWNVNNLPLTVIDWELSDIEDVGDETYSYVRQIVAGIWDGSPWLQDDNEHGIEEDVATATGSEVSLPLLTLNR